MTDIFSKDKRSWVMSRIRSKNTKPEITVRSFLHKEGFRYRLHASDLPGKPDIVLPKYKTVIFVNGCFWHGHNCRLFKSPANNAEFWQNKISVNANNDLKNIALIAADGWKIITFWECAVRGKKEDEIKAALEALSMMIRSQSLPQVLSIPLS